MSDSESDDENKPKPVEKGSDSSESSYEEDTIQGKREDVTEEGKEMDETGIQSQVSDENMSSLLNQQPQPRRKRFIPKYDVEGVHKIILGEETQLQVEMAIGSHISSQYPWKFVDKSKIMESIELGGELSEFFPLKEEIENYPDDLILMGFIPDESKDYDEFYICCTAEARDHCKQQSDRFIKRQEKKLEKAVQKKPRPWTSLGSEKEITSVLPVNKRPLMEIEVKATFPCLHAPDKLYVRDTNSVRDGYIELTPYRQRFNNVYRRRVATAVQAAPAKVDKHAQTELRYPQNKWTQSIADQMGAFIDAGAGGDQSKAAFDEFFGDDDEFADSSSDEDSPQKQPIDEEGLATYKAAFRRLRRPSYIKMVKSFMQSKADEMDDFIELNTVMDIYSNDYPDLAAKKVVDIYDTMTFEEYVCFTDVRAKDKYVSCAVFHPMWSGIVAICYSDGSPTVMKYLGTRPDPIQRAVYGLNPVMIWSHIDSLYPKLYLECTREVKVLEFCPFDENLLIGGCVNGQVVVWDLTHKLDNVETVEVLSETREKYRIAMNAHMGWLKNVHDSAVVPATAMSNLLTSHYGPVTSIKWTSPNFTITPTGKIFKCEEDRKSLIFLTGSEDGTILIWNLSIENINILDNRKVKKSRRVLKRPSGLMVDFSKYKILDRNLSPYYKIILGIAGKPQMLPLQSVALEPPPVQYIYTPGSSGRGRKYFKCEILPQQEDDLQMMLYCGSMHGNFWKITWEGHAFNTGELVNSEYCDLKFKCNIHDGIISRTQKNPFLKNVTLTVGGKIFAIWYDEFEGRPLIWKKRQCRLTDGAWSLYKPSLLFITNSEGNLETWDLLLRSDEPIAVQTVSGSMLTGVSLHTLPLTKNIIGVSDLYGSFRMFIDPPIFMLENPVYVKRVQAMIAREEKVMKSFHAWQAEWMKKYPDVLLEMKRKEGVLLAEKEEERRKQREEEERKLEAEAEAKRLARMRVIGPEERWQQIIQKLIERTIAVKKRINRAELIEHEKPLRELETQRLEKERRMLEIMKNQKAIFNDTVAILFPEAIQKPPKPKKAYLSQDKSVLKKEYLEDYAYLKEQAFKTVKENPYKVSFSWDATITEGKERRQALNAHEYYIKMHKCRLEEEGYKEILEEEEEEQQQQQQRADDYTTGAGENNDKLEVIKEECDDPDIHI